MKNSEQKLLEQKKKMEGCNHLFIKKQNGYWASDSWYKPCIVKCLRCGLTNAYIDAHNNNEILKIFNPKKYSLIKLNNEIFQKQFSGGWREDREILDEMIFNLISNEVFDAENDNFLYQIAERISENKTNDEIFEIMKELSEIDENEKKIETLNFDELTELKNDIRNQKVKVKTK